MLKKNSRFRTQVLGILVEYFASKTELKIVIEEIKKLREDINIRSRCWNLERVSKGGVV